MLAWLREFHGCGSVRAVVLRVASLTVGLMCPGVRCLVPRLVMSPESQFPNENHMQHFEQIFGRERRGRESN